MNRQVVANGPVHLIGQPSKADINEQGKRQFIATLASNLAGPPLALAMQAAMLQAQHAENPLGLDEKGPVPEQIMVNTDMVAQVAVDAAVKILAKVGLSL